MSKNNSQLWPKSFFEIEKNIPDGYSLSRTIHEAILLIKKTQDGYRSILCTKIKENNKTTKVEAFSIEHNWVVYKSIIYPLPVDIHTSLLNSFEGIDLLDLNYKEIIKLKDYSPKNKIIDIEFDKEVFESGKNSLQPNIKHFSGLFDSNA